MPKFFKGKVPKGPESKRKKGQHSALTLADKIKARQQLTEQVAGVKPRKPKGK